MSKAAKSASSAAPAAGDLAFEDALKKLETIVEAMESGELSLEETLARYEEGTRLARHCQGKLSEADLKIKVLEKGADGEPALRVMGVED
jgi:exodeoxyribonuclease VII small subunit